MNQSARLPKSRVKKYLYANIARLQSIILRTRIINMDQLHQKIDDTEFLLLCELEDALKRKCKEDVKFYVNMLDRFKSSYMDHDIDDDLELT